mgnify:CR=1 FL=1
MVLSLKPAGAACNMACTYCYYREKGALTGFGKMSDDTLEKSIRQYAEAMPPNAPLQFLWHGGEPMLMPLSFYRKALDIQHKVASGRPVANSLQTNGTLITPEWADFFAKEGWLLGVSIDGPETVHDRFRRLASGEKTHSALLNGLGLLDSAGAQWNAMATVNCANVGHPDEFYDFFKTIGARYIQFSPIVERRHTGNGLLSAIEPGGDLTPESITAADWGNFLCGVFDRWKIADVGKVFVQIFEATLALKLGVLPGVCIFAPECGTAPIVEADGSVYCCDHFVFDGFRLGNIHTTSLNTMLNSDTMAHFRRLKSTRNTKECSGCRYINLCNGECPKNRFAADTSDNTSAKNYLCEGYRAYFKHVDSFMEHAKSEILARMRQMRHY